MVRYHTSLDKMEDFWLEPVHAEPTPELTEADLYQKALRYFAQQPDPSKFNDQVEGFKDYYQEIFEGAETKQQYAVLDRVLDEIDNGSFPGMLK
jgi:hypothetical protein